LLVQTAPPGSPTHTGHREVLTSGSRFRRDTAGAPLSEWPNLKNDVDVRSITSSASIMDAKLSSCVSSVLTFGINDTTIDDHAWPSHTHARPHRISTRNSRNVARVCKKATARARHSVMFRRTLYSVSSQIDVRKQVMSSGIDRLRNSDSRSMKIYTWWATQCHGGRSPCSAWYPCNPARGALAKAKHPSRLSCDGKQLVRLTMSR